MNNLQPLETHATGIKIDAVKSGNTHSFQVALNTLYGIQTLNSFDTVLERITSLEEVKSYSEKSTALKTAYLVQTHKSYFSNNNVPYQTVISPFGLEYSRD